MIIRFGDGGIGPVHGGDEGVGPGATCTYDEPVHGDMIEPRGEITDPFIHGGIQDGPMHADCTDPVYGGAEDGELHAELSDPLGDKGNGPVSGGGGTGELHADHSEGPWMLGGGDGGLHGEILGG